MTKRTVVCDIEADGLLANVTKIWCIVCKDWDTGEVFSWTPDTLNEFNDWAKAEVAHWIGHNFIAYDLRVLKKVLNVKINPNRVTDTLLISRLQYFTREGGHSLKNWGKILNYPKQEFDDFTQYTPEQLEYCKNDVELTYKVAVYLKSEGVQFGSKESSMIEHLIQHRLEDQNELGFALDVEKAHKLYALLRNKADTLERHILATNPPWPLNKGLVTPKYKKNGELSIVGLKFLEDWTCVSGAFTRVGWEEFNLNSPKQKVKRLEGYWSPTIRTKGYRDLVNNLSPSAKKNKEDIDLRVRYMWKLCEENLATIYDNAPEGLRDLGTFAMLTSRYKEIDGWLDALGLDNRVHGEVYSMGAVTHRMAHTNPNMANVPASGSPYGAECRSCFTVSNPDTHVLLGCDAAGIQLRILAHYMNDKDYTNEVVNGDIHTKNLEAMGINKGVFEDGQWTARDTAKTFIYAWLLGAGDAKVGEIIGGDSEDGRRVKADFLSNIPALARLKERATAAAGLGGMVGIDGRWIEIKSPHFALSCYLQGGESVVMKYATLLWHSEVYKRNLDARMVAIVHDEWQTEVRKEHADEVGDIQVQSIIKAGKYFKLNCPLDGAYKIGLNWADTH